MENFLEMRLESDDMAKFCIAHTIWIWQRRQRDETRREDRLVRLVNASLSLIIIVFDHRVLRNGDPAHHKPSAVQQ